MIGQNIGYYRMRCCKMAFLQGVLTAIFFSVASPLQAQTTEIIQLRPGFSDILRLGRAPHTVTVGNPEIVDAVIGPTTNTILLTAKLKSGVTNLIALDDAGGEIYRAIIEVEAEGIRNSINIRYPSSKDSKDIIVMHSGVVLTYPCQPLCSLRPLGAGGTQSTTELEATAPAASLSPAEREDAPPATVLPSE